MPLYEYKCDVCGKITEVLEKAARNTATGYCASCQEERTFTKLFSVFAAPSAQQFENVGACGEPRGTCGHGGCGCGSH